MGSTDRNARPEQLLSRRNTFQRMLDLEKRNKVRLPSSPAKSQEAIMPPVLPTLDLG